MKIRWVLWLSLLVCSGAGAGQARVQPLTAADVAGLVTAPEQGSRILMLWSLACMYCEPNMQALARLQRAHPELLSLVTVSTDDVSKHADEIADRLQAAGMAEYPARAYAAPVPQRINYLIDPTWGGELPRTVILHADGSRQAVSGLLTSEQLQNIRVTGSPSQH